MIKVGDLVGVDSKFGSTIGIIYDRLEGSPWEWTVVECCTGDYLPCSTDELTLLDNPKQVENWERKRKIKKLLDKHKQTD